MKGWALVTGASSGIGKDLAGLLARDGYGVVLTARRREKLEELAAILRAQGAQVKVLPADLSAPGAAARLLQDLEAAGLALDILINNAGFGVSGPFADTPPEDEAAMMRLHLDAVTGLTKPVLRAMRERGRGRILNVASTAGFQAGPGMAVYYATKAFLISFSEALREECRGTGVTVTVLCPGPTSTGFMEAAGIEDTLLARAATMPSLRAARSGYRAMMAGRAMAIPGFWNALGVFLQRFVPRSWVPPIVKRVQAPAKR